MATRQLPSPDDVVRLVRTHSDDQGTTGRLFSPWLSFAPFTMELPWRGNARRVSCIPAGSYVCAPRQSPRFGRVYEVARVSGRQHVLIHSGNLGGDTSKGWASHIEGCILLGERLAQFKLKAGDRAGQWQRAVSQSGAAMARFHAAMNWRHFLLEVTDP